MEVRQTSLSTVVQWPDLSIEAPQARVWSHQAKCTIRVLKTGTWVICVGATFYIDKVETTAVPSQGHRHGWKISLDA